MHHRLRESRTKGDLSGTRAKATLLMYCQNCRTMRVALAMYASVLVSSCGERTPVGFWGAGVYDVVLWPEPASTYPPGYEEALGPFLDSATATLRVDAVVGDSLFGRWDARLLDIGLTVGIIGGDESRPTQRDFVGSVVGDSFSIEMDPRVGDGGLWLEGSVADSVAVGRWHEDGGMYRGRFEARRSMVTR